MTLGEGATLLLAGLLGGALNSVAGGGSFVTFPALVFVGTSQVVANATNSVALWPAGLASLYAYRKDMRLQRGPFILLLLASFAGALGGAVLLLRTDERTFGRLIPWLMLVASVLFSFGGALAVKLRAGKEDDGGGVRRRRAAVVAAALVQIVIAVYGGYFGGGMGFMMLAMMGLLGMTNIHAMNGLRSVLNTIINGVAMVTFVLAGAVDWARGAVMIVGATAAAYGTAATVRRLDATWVRRFVMVIAWGMTAYFFWRAYGRGGR